MSKRLEKKLVAGLDVGTSKVVAVIAEENLDGQLQIVGIGKHPSRGLKRGVVVNIDATVNAIQHAIEEAELMAGTRIDSVHAGVAGSHVRSRNSTGIVAIRGNEVTEYDVSRVTDSAKAVAIPGDQEILHVVPQGYLIDTQEAVHDPIGMAGVRLESRVHIVTGAVSAIQNVMKCIRQCGVEVSPETVVLEQLASSYAVLSDDEKELGVCLVDIGGGTTDIAVFVDGAIRHTAVIPIAGDQVTNDLAHGLRTPIHFAEQIKIEFGCTGVLEGMPNDLIEVPSVGDRPGKRLSYADLAQYIGPRYEELFNLIHAELSRSGLLDQLTAGIVLTGGTSKIRGAVDLAEQIFEMPVRLGLPQHVQGLADVIRNPIYSTAVGLVLYAAQEQHGSMGYADIRGQNEKVNIWRRMKSWFQGHF
ncbi:cell division protein FtsA [Piscirickettsia salmonis]|uniref:cell division protein FtsA n=1 Tax=Piscirickettsia salmonis TaxID=1238 RepID=UPI0007C9212E|nr:Cell division protein FtsA [Piscirickettsiaceae bacterium NZ-RLO1]